MQMMVTQMANALSAKGYEVEILCTYNLGKPAFKVDDAVRIRYLTNYTPNREAFYNAIKSFHISKAIQEGIKSLKILYAKRKVLINEFRKIKEGIIISTRNEDSVLLSRYGHKEVLKIAQIHHEVHRGDPVYKDLMSRYKNIDTIVLLTEEQKHEIQKDLEKRGIQVPCAAIGNFIVPRTSKATEHRENTILSVGRLHEEKGFLRLLEMFSQVHKVCPDWRLVIVGDGAQKEILMDTAKRLMIDEHVLFAGALSNEEIRLRMAKASIYAMTSHREGFGIVLLEAMDEGLPVISFDVRMGPRAIINHGVQGYLIEDGDLNLYQESLMKLIRDVNLRKTMGEAGSVKATEFYDKHIIEKWVSLFQGNLLS